MKNSIQMMGFHVLLKCFEKNDNTTDIKNTIKVLILVPSQS